MRYSYLSQSATLLLAVFPQSSLSMGRNNIQNLGTLLKTTNGNTSTEQQQQQHRRLDDVPPWFDNPFTESPTDAPTASPTDVLDTPSPTMYPTDSPTNSPTDFVTASPTDFVTDSPTVPPTDPPTLAPTMPPTLPPPTDAPTPNPTPAPTTPPPTSSPSSTPSEAPTPQPESIKQSTLKANGGQLTNCTYVPTSSGNSITENLDLEYFLYLNDATAGVTDAASVQAVVDSLQRDLHSSLSAVVVECGDFVSKDHVIVSLSNDGPGSDLVGAPCSITETSPAGATSCHQVWAQMSLTVYYTGSRRHTRRVLRDAVRNLQTSPFGDPTVFSSFTTDLEIAFATLPDAESGVVETEFKGFVNLNGISGTVLSDPKDIADPVDSFIASSSQSKKNSGLPFSYGHVAIALAGLVMLSTLLLVLVRRGRNRRAYSKHAKDVDALVLDPIDEIDESPEVVDDASLFQEEEPLPEEFEVQLEDSYHDYRTCASPTCRACLQRKDPVFVSTNMRGHERQTKSWWRSSPPVNTSAMDDTQIL